MTPFEKQARQFIQRHMDECYNNIVAGAPRDTGAYIESIQKTDIVKTENELYAEIYTDLDSGWNGVLLAKFLENGTGIYREDGTGRQTPWVYWSEKLQRFVFTRGMKPRPHWRPAYEIQKMKMQAELGGIK